MSDKDQPKHNGDPRVIDIHLEYEIISTTNGFFGTVRNITLDSGYVTELDLSELHHLLYSENAEISSSERTTQAEAQIKRLREELDGIDRQLDPSKFRRVFERIGDPGTHSLELVIQYYISKTNKSKEDRDKVDLLVTRWGSFSVPGTQKLPVLRPAKDLENKLNDLYQALGMELISDEEEARHYQNLCDFADEVAQINNFRDIVEKQLVRRLREYKTSINDNFYRPKLLSKIVEVNISIHNLFQELYDSEQARLHLYLEQAKKSALNDEQARQLAQFQPIFKMMNRAAQMDHLIDDIKQALATQQVVDQTFLDQIERTGRKMKDLTELLVGALQNSRHVSEQLHQSLNSIQRLEKVTVHLSAIEKQILENVAGKLEKSMEQLITEVIENTLVSIAEAVKEERLNDLFPKQTEKSRTAVSFLIGAGFTSPTQAK